MLAQLRRLGLSHDPGRRFSTHEPDYYRWTQWIFLQLFESFYDPTVEWTGPDGARVVGRARRISELPALLKSGEWHRAKNGAAAPGRDSMGRPLSDAEIADVVDRSRLAFVDEVPVNWCPQLGTVLANEEVTADGRSERGNFPVFKRPLRQWILRITAYAERLIQDLEPLDWPLGVLEMQRNWIGRSTGCEVDFAVPLPAGGTGTIRVFTTRPDTLFGATFVVLSPEHPLVEQITTADRRDAVAKYKSESTASKFAAHDEDAPKTGTFTGACAINPVNGARTPIWIASYVLMEYGTGAIMAVPAHDTRDFDFAKQNELPILPVVSPDDEWLREQAATMGLDGDDAAVRAAYLRDPAGFPNAFTGDGASINSTGPDISISDLATPRAKEKISDWIEATGRGARRVNYKLKDWLFSRQRYWGEPFPVLFESESGRAHAMDESQLPARLPELTDFSPRSSDDPNSAPEPPLARVPAWMNVRGVILDCGAARIVDAAVGANIPIDGKARTVRAFKRDANTMPNWAGSCWYYLRYCDPANQKAMVDCADERYWMMQRRADGSWNAGGVDLYVGGAEHAVLHLLYARFWHKVLYDLGYVSTREPFQKLFNQGMITANAYVDSRGFYVDSREVVLKTEDGKDAAYSQSGEKLKIETGKMGKRYKNGLPPEEVCDEYSADVLRLYEMYMGPLEATKPWDARAIIGMQRFLNSVWRAVEESLSGQRREPPDAIPTEIDRMVHRTVQKVTEDIDRLRMNTAIAATIELTNAILRAPAVRREHLVWLVQILSPFAPHMCEELFVKLAPGEASRLGSILRSRWPVADPALCVEDEVEMPVMVNGRKRAVLKIAAEAPDDTIKSAILAESQVAGSLGGKPVTRWVIVRKKGQISVNMVVPQ